MCDVIEEMKHQLAETFFRYNIFLAADMAKSTYNCCAAIETVLFRSFRCVAQNKFLLN